MANPNPTPPPESGRFKPGQSGNPAGRPPGIPNTATRLKRFLELSQKIKNPINGEEEEITVAEQLDLAMIAKARKGDVRAFNALMDRLEGKPPQYIEQKSDLTTNGESINKPTSDIVDRFLQSVKDDIDEQADAIE